MTFTAIDARADAANHRFLGMALHSDAETAYLTDWGSCRAALARAGVNGDTLVAHRAEEQCSILFLAHGEQFRAHYNDDMWRYGEWWYKSGHGPIQVWDSYQLSGGMPISKLAEGVGVEWLETPQAMGSHIHIYTPRRCFTHKRKNCEECEFEVARYKWTCKEHNKGECYECWQTRVARSVHAYMEHYTGFLAQYSIPPKRSLSSASLALWRKLDNPAPIWMRSRDVDSFCREGYIGSRVEAVKVGHIGENWYADVHMMYPHIMATVEMPTPQSTEINGSVHLDERWIRYEGITEATVRIPECYVPPLPVPHNGELVFPVGTVRATFTNVELRAAVVRGCIIQRVHRVVYALETVPAFLVFANALMEEREKLEYRNHPYAIVVKQLLNRLYGRVGFRGEHRDATVFPLPPGKGDWQYPKCEVQLKRGSILLRETHDRTIRDRWANPLWAATITGYARVRLLECMEAQSANLVYADTDSIISLAPVVGVGEGAGALRAIERYDEGWIIAPKLYHLSGGAPADRLVVGGIPRGQALRFMRDRVAQWSRPVGIDESFGSGLFPGELHMLNQQRRLTLTKRHVLDSSAIEQDGRWSDTRPLSFGDTVGMEDWSVYKQSVGWHSETESLIDED